MGDKVIDVVIWVNIVWRIRMWYIAMMYGYGIWMDGIWRWYMTIGIGMTMVMSTGITGMSTKGCRDYVTNKDMVCRGGSNSIAKYCNTFEIL